MKTIDLELLRANKERRDAESATRLEHDKVCRVIRKKIAGVYLQQFHLFELQETHYSPTRLTGEQKIMLGHEAKEINERLRKEFHDRMCDCLDKNIPRTVPMRHWKLMDKNVEPPNQAAEPEGEK